MNSFSVNNAVQFGNTVDRGAEAQKAFPFFYTLVHPDFEVPANTDTLLGLTVLPQGRRQVAIILDNDYNFKLLWIRFTACLRLLAGGYTYYNVATVNDVTPGDTEQLFTGELWMRYIRVSLSSTSNQATLLYGGANTDPIVYNAFPDFDTIPLQIQSIQGYDYGVGQCHLPYLCPAGGTLRFDLYNTHARNSFIVNAVVYGMKVRV